jgi:hypothetical protein
MLTPEMGFHPSSIPTNNFFHQGSSIPSSNNYWIRPGEERTGEFSLFGFSLPVFIPTTLGGIKDGTLSI